jgi:membrane-bound acyltransferase YfiQ involved in biofilm formation
VSYVIYALVMGLVLWGVKFAGKNQFNNDFMSLEVTKCLQGICAVCIICHHMSQTGAFQQTGELSLFHDMGVCFVGIFFFCSGYGLIKSMQTKPGYMNTFLKKRLLTVLIPFYTMTVAFAVYDNVVGTHMTALQWILSLSGLILINSHSWYIVVIALLYLAFYFCFTKIKSEKKAFTVMGIFILAQMILGVIWGHLAWWAGKPFWWQAPDGFSTAKWWMMPCTWWFQGEWWINSTALFFAGLIFARFEQPVVGWLKQNYWIKLVVLAVVVVAGEIVSQKALNGLSYWSEFGTERSLGIGKKYICLITQTVYVTAFVCFVFMVMMKMRSINPVTKFLGKIVLEIYLMHNLLLMRFGFLIGNIPGASPIVADNRSNLILFAAIVICGAIVIGTVFNFLNHKLIKLVTNRK